MLQFEIQECLMNYGLTQRRVPYSDPDRYIFLLIICLESFFLSKIIQIPSYFHLTLDFSFPYPISSLLSYRDAILLGDLWSFNKKSFSRITIKTALSFPCPTRDSSFANLVGLLSPSSGMFSACSIIFHTINPTSSARSKRCHPAPVHSE